MALPLDEACCASFPAAALAALAAVRTWLDVAILAGDDRCWVWWQSGETEVLARVLAVPGVELYVHRDGLWYPFGHRLPSFDVPERTAARPLHRLLTPAPVQPELAGREDWSAYPLTLACDDRPRTTTALRCHLDELAQWAETATTAQLMSLQGALCGSEVILLGQRLPAVVHGERFWGRLLLVPLGYRPEPGLPESALCSALGIGEAEIALLSQQGLEILARASFQPLTRAGIRRAAQEEV
jgi:hypothetical protein